jgi:hypothetical protein
MLQYSKYVVHLSMTNAQVVTNEKVRGLNLQINSQLKRNGVLNHKGQLVIKLSDMPASEWKTWITELITYRDELQNQLPN